MFQGIQTDTVVSLASAYLVFWARTQSQKDTYLLYGTQCSYHPCFLIVIERHRRYTVRYIAQTERVSESPDFDCVISDHKTERHKSNINFIYFAVLLVSRLVKSRARFLIMISYLD